MGFALLSSLQKMFYPLSGVAKSAPDVGLGCGIRGYASRLVGG